MENSLNGTLVSDGIQLSKPIRAFVQKRIRKWLEQRKLAVAGGAGGTRGADPRYAVTLVRGTQGHRVECQILVQEGSTWWAGAEIANGLHQAVLKALDHMFRTQPSQLTPLTPSLR